MVQVAATLLAGVLEGRLERECEIVLPGGSAFVSWSELDNHIRLRGPADKVFAGDLDLKNIGNGALIANLCEVVSDALT